MLDIIPIHMIEIFWIRPECCHSVTPVSGRFPIRAKNGEDLCYRGGMDRQQYKQELVELVVYHLPKALELGESLNVLEYITNRVYV